jgi:hypothetical protein
MNQKLLLSLVAIPTLTGSILAVVLLPLVAAAETIAPFQKDVLSSELTFCSFPVEPETSSTLEYPVLDFSEAESDAAVALFGCDCPACINTLRQLRSQPLEQLVLSSKRVTNSDEPTLGKHLFPSSSQLVTNDQIAPNQLTSEEAIAQSNAPVSHSVQGHCWENLQRRATLEDVQNVLRTLEEEEPSQ